MGELTAVAKMSPTQCPVWGMASTWTASSCKLCPYPTLQMSHLRLGEGTELAQGSPCVWAAEPQCERRSVSKAPVEVPEDGGIGCDGRLRVEGAPARSRDLGAGRGCVTHFMCDLWPLFTYKTGTPGLPRVPPLGCGLEKASFWETLTCDTDGP